MPARDEEERERPPPSRWEGEAPADPQAQPWRRDAPYAASGDLGSDPGRDTAATHGTGWGSPPGQGSGPVQGTAYGSGRWGRGAGQESPSGYGGPSATGYGQGMPGYSGYGQGDPGAGVSHAGASGYAGYAGAHTPQTPLQPPRPCGPAEEARVRPDWFDLDYQQWRDEQVRKLDNDYRSWRQSRYRKFADEFDAWRSRQQGPAATSAQAEGLRPAPPQGSGSSMPADVPGTPPSPSFPTK